MNGRHGGFSLLWALVLLSCAASYSPAIRSAGGAELNYSENLGLIWGEVNFTVDGMKLKETSWYTRKAPTFTNGGVFSAAQTECLSNSFMVCAGRVGNALVWRITDGTISGDGADSFRRKAAGSGCGVIFGNFAPVPDPGEHDGQTQEWTLSFSCTIETPKPDPNVELTLLVPDVPD